MVPLSNELLAEVRRLQFHTRRVVNQDLAGGYRSAFRGRGMEFEEVREYAPGMEIRSIDWKVTARRGMPFVKTYREERELTVMLLIDVSPSTATGTRKQFRRELIAQVGAVLTLIALRNNDKVGLLTFGDNDQRFYPPRKGRGAQWRILRELLSHNSREQNPTLVGSQGSKVAQALRFLMGVLPRRSVIFLLSDFLDTSYEELLPLVSRKHDLTGLLAGDPSDLSLPSVGLCRFLDPESGQELVVDTSDPAFQRSYQQEALARLATLRAAFHRSAVPLLELSTDTSFMPTLRQYFGRRSQGMKR